MFLPFPTISMSTSDERLAHELQRAQKRDLNGLCQRQCRELKQLHDEQATEAVVVNFKHRVSIEKQRVRLRNYLMLKHGLTLAIYNDPHQLATFQAELEGKYRRRDLALLWQVREGQGLEYLEYANDDNWIVTNDEELDDATVRMEVKKAMEKFDVAMDSVVGANWDHLMSTEPAFSGFTESEDVLEGENKDESEYGSEEEDEEEGEGEDEDEEESGSDFSESPTE